MSPPGAAVDGSIPDASLYGLVAEFDDPDRLLDATRRARTMGYRRMDAFCPFPLEGLSEALSFRDYSVAWIMLAGGIIGALSGFGLLCWTTVVAYPLDIGGRPTYTWPSFIPITFEMTVLLASLSGVVGMFALNGLPQPYHPVFDAPNFDRCSSDRFFLCIEARDARFDRGRTRRFMETLGALNVAEVEQRK